MSKYAGASMLAGFATQRQIHKACLLLQLDSEVNKQNLAVPKEETELQQVLLELQARLRSTAASITNIFQQACYGITSNPFSLVADVQSTLQQHSVFLGSSFLFEQLVRGLSKVKDGFVGALSDQPTSQQQSATTSPEELAVVLKVFHALAAIVAKYDHSQEPSALSAICAEDALLDNLLVAVKSQLVPTLSQSRAGLRRYLSDIERLTAVFCSVCLQGVLQATQEAFNRYYCMHHH